MSTEYNHPIDYELDIYLLIFDVFSVSFIQKQTSRLEFFFKFLYFSICFIYKKLVTLVKSDPKGPFSIAIKSRCRGRALLYSLDCSTLPLILTL